MRPRSSAIRVMAFGAMLTFAVVQSFVYATPVAAQEGGSANGGGAGPGGTSGSSSPHGNSHELWIGAAGQRWLSNSAARLAAPLRTFLRRTQRASAHAAADLVKAGQSSVSAPFNWLAGRVKTAPNDQDKAMAAVRDGEIVPLASVLKTVEKSVPGDVLNVALTRDTVGSWNYTITVLTPQGYYRDVNVDAGSNNVTSIRSH